jgi:hypothetical protein
LMQHVYYRAQTIPSTASPLRIRKLQANGGNDVEDD